MGRLIVENAAVAGKSLPPPTDVSWGEPPVLPPPPWDGYPSPVDADEKVGATAAGSSHAVPYPSNMAVGDLVIVRLSAAGVTLNFPAAVTQIAAGTRLDVRGIVGYRRWTGAEGTTFTVTTDAGKQVLYHVYRVLDAHPTTPPEAGAAVDDACCTAETNPPVPQYALLGWGAEKNLWFATIGTTTAPAITSWPAAYPFRRTEAYAGKLQRSSYGKAQQATAPGGPTQVWAVGTVNFVRWTIAVRPRPA